MADSTDIAPTVDEVAALIATRTIEHHGDEVGTFTPDTRPTDLQASDLCAVAAGDVMIALGVEGDELSDEFVGEARQLAALRRAQLVLMSFYPETQTTGATATYAAAYLAGVEELAGRAHWSAFRLQ